MNSEILDRLPPSDARVEMGLLGAIMIKAKCLDDVAEIIQPDDFYGDANRRLYLAFQAMHAARIPLDNVGITSDWLSKNGELEAIGGRAHLGECLTSEPTAAHAVYYAGIVARHSKKRAIIRALTAALPDAYDPAQTPDAVLSTIETALSEIATSQFGGKLVDAPTAVLAAMDRIEAITQRAESAGLFTGLETFDDSIGGLFDGELVVLTARSGVGKTALACQIVAHNAARERLTYVASLEMNAAELVTRMLCTAAGVDGRKIRTNKLDGADYAKLTAAAEKLAKFAVRFDERPEITVADVRRSTRRLLKDGLKLVVVDYLQIVTPDDPWENRERQVANMSKQLKALARELKVPVLVLCQSNRDAEKDKTASLRHLRESDAIGQNADVVLVLECGAIGTAKQHEAWLTVLKNRNGPKGKMQLDWHPAATMFTCHQVAAAEMDNYEPAFEQEKF